MQLFHKIIVHFFQKKGKTSRLNGVLIVYFFSTEKQIKREREKERKTEREKERDR